MDNLVLFGAAALLVRVGLATHLAGLTRAKNSAGVIMRLLCDLCLTVLIFWAVGGAILGPVFGLKDRVIMAGMTTDGRSSAGVVFFLASVVAIGTGIVIGAMGERSKFFPSLAGSLLLGGLIIPVGASWAWNGWLHKLGFIDAAGASWLHLAGGLCAAAGAWMLGPRDGKYHRDGSASVIPGHSVPLASLGTVMMIAGWIPYVSECVMVGWNDVRTTFGPEIARSAGSMAALNVLLGRWRPGASRACCMASSATASPTSC